LYGTPLPSSMLLVLIASELVWRERERDGEMEREGV
jgi:hypothetical protein